MVGQTNKYERNFEQQGQLKRPGRIDLRIFQYLANAGDGYPGLQYSTHKIFGESLFPRFVIEGCSYDGSSVVSAGYVMYDGKVVQVSAQTGITVNNSEFLYINSIGIAQVTAVEATAKAGVMIYARDSVGAGKTIIFSYQDNELYIYDAVIRHDLEVNNDVVIDNDLTVVNDVDINGDVDIDGVTNLDNVDIDGVLDVAGVADFHEDIDMNTKKLTNVGDPTNLQDSATKNFVKNYLPVGTILMYNGVGWVDNNTIPGWYKCDGSDGTPNLTNKFIRSEATSGNTGGADSVTLAANQIPSHSTGGQSASHTHTIYSGGAHTHSFYIQGKHPYEGCAPEATAAGAYCTFNTGSAGSHSHTMSGQSASHTHTFTNASQQSVENRPAYYSLIFVIRMS